MSNDILGTDEEKVSLIVEQKNPYLNDPLKGMELMARLIAKPARQETIAKKLEKLHHELHGSFLHICNQEHTPNEAELFLQLHKAFKDLEELVGFTALANKNVVAVGGSFSAGKSRFINSMLGDKDLLPWDTKTTTAIPTHIIKGETETIRAINTLNTIIDLDRDSFKAICHDFYRIYKVGFSHIIKLVTIEKPDFPYANISFLDTPGYSASSGKSMERGDNTDETIAREHLSQANYLLWVVSAKDGGISSSDIEFLLSLNKSSLGKIPELFLVHNKADLLPPGKDLINVMTTARNALITANIPCVGAAAFNSLKGMQVMGDSITDYLVGIDKKNKTTMMAKKFSTVFQAFTKHNFEEQQQAQQLFGFLQTVQLRLAGTLTDEEKVQEKALAESARHKSAGLKGIISDFEAMAAKVDGMVQGIMQDIKVKEVSADDHGIPVIFDVKDDTKFATLICKQILTGKVNFSDLLGVYIDFGLGEDVPLYTKKVKDRYSCDPKILFPVGAECRATIHEIKRSEKKVKLVILPGLE